MAVLVTSDIPNGNQAQDEAMMAEMGVRQSPPPGIMSRAAGPIPGGWRIVTVWESRDAFEAFHREKIAPAVTKLGVAAPQITSWELASYIAPPQR